MSDHNERACRNCGSYLHHEDECPKPSPDAMSGLDAEDIEQIEQALELKMYNIEMAHLQQLLRMLYSKVKGQAPQPVGDKEKALEGVSMIVVGGKEWLLHEEVLKAMDEYAASKGKNVIDFLKLHEQWEADFISENSLWWPNREKDALNGRLYETFLELQSKRNALLNKDQNVQVSDTTGDDSSNAADQIKYDKLYEDFQTLCRTNEIFREENKRYKDYAGELQEKLKEKEVEIVKLKKELDGWVRYKQNIDEALNSGDGTYRP